MENLTRYNMGWDNIYEEVTERECSDGEFVKFSDIKDILKTPTNKQSESLLCGMCGEPLEGTCYVANGIVVCIDCPWE